MLDSFGRALLAPSRYAVASTIDELRELILQAGQEGLPVTLRGSGRSYGDAALNRGGLVIDATAMNRLLAWDPARGVADVEPGMTIEGLWRRTIEDGFWPAVVPGSMFPTLAGCLAMNVHGKNNFRTGTFGEHVLDFDLLTSSGDLVCCSREHNPDVFYAAIGGAGLLGVITRLRLRLKRVESGLLRVRPVAGRCLGEMLDIFEQRLPRSDYLVGWVDCFATGQRLGRGVVHQANYVPAEEVADAAGSLHVERQTLPSSILGVPKAWAWLFMRPLMNDIGGRLTNALKYGLSRLEPPSKSYLQSHVGFAFLLDYLPNWRLAYGPHGFVQHQVFVPASAAREVLPEVLRLCHARGHPSYLGVLKRHRPDDFLLSHGLDGYSLALDFPVRPCGRASLWKMLHEIADLTLGAGGRFYFAKDAALTAGHCRQAFSLRLDQFRELKARLDPEGVFASDLWRRLIAAQSG
ncbi:MAG TPA: FAD-binding oxidoreductase [Chloroflexota bacterium]